MIVVNRPGAGGAIGYRYVRGAEAGRHFAGLELKLDLDHVPFRQLAFDYKSFVAVAQVLVESPGGRRQERREMENAERPDR